MSVSVPQHKSGYLSSKEAGSLVGYTSDYVARLAREGKIVGERIGVQWFVELNSLHAFFRAAEVAREERKKVLREQRKSERRFDGHTQTHISARTVTGAPAQQLVKHEPGTHVDFFIQHDDVPLRDPRFDSGRVSAHKVTFSVLTSGLALAALVVFFPAMTISTPSAESRITPHTLAAIPRQEASVVSAFTDYLTQFFFPSTPTHVAHIAPLSQHDTPTRDTSTQRDGIVILPPTASEKTIQAVKDSFSDDVQVSLDADGHSGRVTPVFTDGTGDSYRFILVPVNVATRTASVSHGVQRTMNHSP